MFQKSIFFIDFNNSYVWFFFQNRLATHQGAPNQPIFVKIPELIYKVNTRTQFLHPTSCRLFQHPRNQWTEAEGEGPDSVPSSHQPSQVQPFQVHNNPPRLWSPPGDSGTVPSYGIGPMSAQPKHRCWLPAQCWKLTLRQQWHFQGEDHLLRFLRGILSKMSCFSLLRLKDWWPWQLFRPGANCYLIPSINGRWYSSLTYA